MDGYLAQILIFAGDFAPRGWALCHGQLLPISQHETLFAIIGNRYGGDGKASFALPDLRDKTPVGSPTTAAFTAQKTRRAWSRLRRHVRPAPFPANFVICIEGTFPERP